MNVLVTGAGGFIGSHVTELLLREGHRVRALVRYNSTGTVGHLNSLPAELLHRLAIRLGDVTDPFLMRDLVDDCEIVLHLAALIGIPYSYVAPASYVATNVSGTLNGTARHRHFYERGLWNGSLHSHRRKASAPGPVAVFGEQNRRGQASRILLSQL
jgi:UDP-glucose 4-epimerase